MEDFWKDLIVNVLIFVGLFNALLMIGMVVWMAYDVARMAAIQEEEKNR